MSCEHEYKDGIRCEREQGHNGTHSKYECVASKKGETPFKVYEWNNDGQTRPKEHFEVYACDFDSIDAELEKIVEKAIEDARSALPKGTVFEIRGKPYPPTDENAEVKDDFRRLTRTRREIAENWGVAWYAFTTERQGFEYLSLPREPLCRFKAKEGETVECAGYVLIARLTA